MIASHSQREGRFFRWTLVLCLVAGLGLAAAPAWGHANGITHKNIGASVTSDHFKIRACNWDGNLDGGAAHVRLRSQTNPQVVLTYVGHNQCRSVNTKGEPTSVRACRFTDSIDLIPTGQTCSVWVTA